jgi:hypothetical protein
VTVVIACAFCYTPGMRIGGFYLVLGLAFWAQACGGFATFRPAKGAVEQPALKESFRVKAVTPDCVLLGYVNAEGDRALQEISETAALHGANNYLIVNENRDERITTQSGDYELTTRTNRKLLAEAYRCMMSGDLPK